MPLTTARGITAVALLFSLAAPAPAQRPPLPPAVTIQAQLDAFPRSNGLWNDVPMGGRVQLDGGAISLGTASIRLSSGQTIAGVGPGTVLTFNGPPGTSAILIRSWGGHGYVVSPSVRDMQIVCPNGADAIALDPSCRYVEGLTVADVVIAGGRVNLPGENYFCTLSRVLFKSPRGQYARLDGQGYTLHSIWLDPNARLPIESIKNPPRAMLEIHGSATIDGWSKLEGGYGVPLLWADDWQGWEGCLVLGPAWIEAHANGPLVVARHSRVFANEVNFSKMDNPLVLKEGSRLFVGAIWGDEKVQADASSKVIIGGQATTRAAMTER